MTTYDHFKQNPGFQLWNVVEVVQPDEKTWKFGLISRDKERVAIVEIRKMTLAELQKQITDVAVFYCAREDTGITIINNTESYITSVAIHNTSQKDYEDYVKHWQDNGLTDNVVFKMGKKLRETAIADYAAWKQLPQTPLENPINSWEPRKCYFGLPQIVYMHLVGQLCTNI